MDCLILTCDRDWKLANLLVRGLRRFWPQVTPRLILDTDRSTETPLPDDVREVVRRVPYLRRVFDFPRISESEDYVVLDSDCLIYDTPTEFYGYAFQGNPGGPDRDEGVALWSEMGETIDSKNVRFCSGMYRIDRTSLMDNRALAIEWVRRCVAKGYDRHTHRGVICSQSLIAGIWRKLYQHNPLPAKRYPYGRFVPGCAIWHMSSELPTTQYGSAMISAYEALI